MLPVAYVASGAEFAAALVGSVQFGGAIRAVISLAGRPDMAESAVPDVTAPTLLIVGGLDDRILGLNQGALRLLKSEKQLVDIPDAAHEFQEPAKLAEAIRVSLEWPRRHVPGSEEPEPSERK